MADPLSIAGSIIGVLQLSAKVCCYIVSVAGATKQRVQLLEEIRGCESVLLQLQVIVDDAKTDATKIVSLLAGSDGPFQRLRFAFEAIQKELTPKAGLGKVVSTLGWPFTERQVSGLVSAIQREKALLLVALTADSR